MKIEKKNRIQFSRRIKRNAALFNSVCECNVNSSEKIRFAFKLQHRNRHAK